MAQLTLETVKLAIETLKTQGLKPTNRKIIDYLGYGSFSTLKKIREHHPKLFAPIDTIAPTTSNTLLEQRVSSLETSLQSIQQMLQTSRQNNDLQQQLQELTENLHEMYQLWQELTQQLSSKSNPSPQKETTITAEESPSEELPNPQQVEKFISWVEQQKKLHHGALKPIVEWLNQHQIPMVKGQSWTTESLSNFLRKKRQQFKGNFKD